MGKYNQLTMGATEAVFNRLGGANKVQDFLSGKVVHVPQKWRPWFQDGSDFFGRVDPIDLGFEGGTSLLKLYCRALDLGLKLCNEADAKKIGPRAGWGETLTFITSPTGEHFDVVMLIGTEPQGYNIVPERRHGNHGVSVWKNSYIFKIDDDIKAY